MTGGTASLLEPKEQALTLCRRLNRYFIIGRRGAGLSELRFFRGAAAAEQQGDPSGQLASGGRQLAQVAVDVLAVDDDAAAREADGVDARVPAPEAGGAVALDDRLAAA